MWILILIARCKFLGEVRLDVEKGGADGNRARGRKTEEKGDGEEAKERERKREKGSWKRERRVHRSRH